MCCFNSVTMFLVVGVLLALVPCDEVQLVLVCNTVFIVYEMLLVGACILGVGR
jgi:hypothetical protein